MPYIVVLFDSDLSPEEPRAYEVREVDIPEAQQYDSRSYAATRLSVEEASIVACLPRSGCATLFEQIQSFFR